MLNTELLKRSVRGFGYRAAFVLTIIPLLYALQFVTHTVQIETVTAAFHPNAPAGIVITPEMRDISKTPEGRTAQRDALIALLKKDDPDSILKVVDAIDRDRSLSLDCHDMAHDIGHAVYEMYGFSRAMAMNDLHTAHYASVMDICAGGILHGILEQASLYDPDFGMNPGALCKDVPAHVMDSCHHGLGHALMFLTARDLSQSLTGCRTLDSAYDSSRCFEGIFMELFWGSDSHAKSLGWDPEDPLLTCVDGAADTKPACFLYSAFGYLRIHQKDYDGAIAACTTERMNPSDTGFCLKGVGITMMSRFKASGLERSESYVEQLEESERYSFYLGVIGYGHFSGMSRSELEDSCARFQHDSGLCFRALATIQ